MEGYPTYNDCYNAGVSMQQNDSRIDQWYCATYPDSRTWYDLDYHATS